MIPPEILNYVILRQIGSGGMGHVFLARNKNIEQYVAVKMLHPRFAGNPLLRQKFKQEAVLLSSLNHPNIVRFLNYVENEYGVFLIMEFVDGMTLEDYINKKTGLIVEKRAYPMINEILDAFTYAHGRNIVHLDIKPSNIFITRDGHVKVMDFGIAKIISETDPESNRQTMGTPEFMSPEQVLNRPLDARSDIYSLGVLIHQMLTGRVPYDNTTMSQLEIKERVINDPLPKMKEYYPYISDGMQKVVDKATAKRPEMRYRSCTDMRSDIRRIIEPEKVNRKLLYTWIAAGLILVLAGFLTWDYFRVKVDYYADYTEKFGIPVGLGSLSGREMKHREHTYRMESSRRKPRRLTLVNSKGVPVRHTDTENSATRFTDVEYFYTDDGNIDYKKMYDEYGRLLFKLDYDENLKTATFKYDDEYGTPMRLLAETTNTFANAQNGSTDRSSIVRHLLRFDEKTGMLQEIRFAGLNNEPLGDSDNIYGMAFEHDKDGRVTMMKFLGPDGTPRNNHIGLGTKTFAYDKDGNWTEVRYYAVDGSPSHDGQNVAAVEIVYDKWGNRAAEYYRSATGEPVVRSDTKSYGFAYEYDDRGNRVRQTYLGADSKPLLNEKGIACMIQEFDDNGRPVKVTYEDAEGNPCTYLEDGDVYAGIVYDYTDRGLPKTLTAIDSDGKPVILTSVSFATIKWEYDSAGYPVKINYYNEKGKPTGYKRANPQVAIEYDDLHRETRRLYQDVSGKPVEDEEHFGGYELTYDVTGNLSQFVRLGLDGKPADVPGYVAVIRHKYDERGNCEKTEFFNAKDDKTVNGDGIHRYERIFDPATNMLTEVRGYNTSNLLTTDKYAYDANGNQIKNYTLDAGGRLKGVVINNKYDKYNRMVEMWATRLDGSRVNLTDHPYSKVRIKYDERGNPTERAFFDAGDKPALDEMSTHRRVSGYDNLNRIVTEKNYGKDDKPAQGHNAYPEGRVEYDSRGNMTMVAAYDGYGKPYVGADGYHKLTMEYDKHNHLTKRSFTGVDGKPVKSKSYGAATVEYKYDDTGNNTSEKYFKVNGEVDFEYASKYNDHNQVVEICILNSKGKLHPERIVNRLKFEYEADGLTPVSRKYYSNTGACILTERYNKKTGKWS